MIPRLAIQKYVSKSGNWKENAFFSLQKASFARFHMPWHTDDDDDDD